MSEVLSRLRALAPLLTNDHNFKTSQAHAYTHFEVDEAECLPAY